MAEAYDIVNVAEGTAELIGVDVRFFAVPHLDESYGVAVGGRSLVYTSDTGLGGGFGDYGPAPGEAQGPPESLLSELEGAGTLLTEASYTHAREGEGMAHLSGREAGLLAAEAGARRLILTHLWPHEDREAILGEARMAFGGPVVIAEEGEIFEFEELRSPG